MFKAKKYKAEIENLQAYNTSLTAEIQKYKAAFTDEHNKAIEIKALLESLKNKELELNTVILQKECKISELQCTIENLGKEIVELDDEILYQSFALYTPLYDFASSDQYKERFDEIRKQQKEMIKNKTAVSANTKWEVNGSKAAGTKLINDNIKQILRSFNTECENVIDRVKFNNYKSMKDRITKSYEMLNKLNEINQISIENKYLALKRQELILAYEYQQKKQQYRESLRMKEKLTRGAAICGGFSSAEPVKP